VRPIVSLAITSVWLGAAILLTVVAQAAFATLPSRALAGALVGRTLPVVFVSGLVAALAVAILGATARSTPFAWARFAGALILGAACAVAQFGVGPRIARVHQMIAGPVDALPLDDPRRVAFGRLHGASVALLACAILAAVAIAVSAALAARPRP
jgi:hypothetical protein